MTIQRSRRSGSKGPTGRELPILKEHNIGVPIEGHVGNLLAQPLCSSSGPYFLWGKLLISLRLGRWLLSS